MRWSHLRRPAAWGLVLYMALLWALWQGGAFRVHAPPELAALVRAPEAVVEGTLLSGVTPKRPGDRFFLRVGETKLLVYLRRGRSEGLRPGQRLRLRGRLRGPARALNPGDFPERDFLDMRGAALVLHARDAQVLSGPPLRWRPWARGEAVHQSMHAWLKARFEPVTASLLEGFALGYRGALPLELERDLLRAGVVHLLGASADKVTAPMAAAVLLGLALRLRPGARDLLALGVGALQLLIVLPDPSHARPWLMYAAWAGARAAGRDPGALQALSLAAWIQLLWEPRQLFNAGFALTYGAALSLAVLLPAWSPPASWPPAARLAGAALALEAALHLALSPAFAAYFGVLSLAGALVNLLAVPAAALAAAAAWAGWLLPAPFDALPAALAEGVVSGFLGLCRGVAARPWAAVPVPAPGPGSLAVYAAAAAAVAVLPDRAAAKALSGASLALAAFLAVLRAVERPALEMTVLEGRRGGTALAFLPDGRPLALEGDAPAGALRAALRGADGAAAAPAPLALSWGGARLVWDGRALVAALGGKEVYCVRSGSPTDAPPPCPPSATVGTRRAGAAGLKTDGRTIQLRLLARRGIDRGPVP